MTFGKEVSESTHLHTHREAIMHVAILYGYGFNASGSAIYAMNMVEALRKEGHDVTLFCHETREDLIQTQPGFQALHTDWGWLLFNSEGTERCHMRSITEKPIPVSYARPELQGVTTVSDLTPEQRAEYVDRMTQHLENVHSECAIDMVIVHHLSLLVEVGARFQDAHAVPFHVVVHGTALHYVIRELPEVRDTVAEHIQSATSVVALNPSVKARVLADLPEAHEVITITPPGVNAELFRPRTTPNQQKVVGFVGRMTLDKGVHNLMAAFVDVHDQLPGVKLDLFGHGPDMDALREAHAAMAVGDKERFIEACRVQASHGRTPELAEEVMAGFEAYMASVDEGWGERARSAAWNIHFRGYVVQRELAACYRGFDIMVLPSIVPEAFPLVLLESMASGVVSVASNDAGQGWLLGQVESEISEVDGRLTYEPTHATCVAELGERVASLIAEPPQGGFAERAHQFVESHYCWRNIVNQIMSANPRARVLGTLDEETFAAAD